MRSMDFIVTSVFKVVFKKICFYHSFTAINYFVILYFV